uniref:hypothetical protein n=1 Tax=Candidatus Electrothrix sp. TaxID=2170559 RepID=UPI004055CDCF
MNPKKALKKGLAGITEEDFINTMMLYVKEHSNQDSSQNSSVLNDNEMLKEKYPFYRQIVKMTVSAAKSGDRTQIIHFSGMSVAYRILIQIAEDKGR